MSIKFNLKNITFFNEKEIKGRKILSKSFGMICEKIDIENNLSYVLKRVIKKKIEYNALKKEALSLVYMYKLFPNLFPKIYYQNDDLIIMDYIKHNKYKGDNFEKELADKISSIHKIKNSKYGFEFDTPIGALKQPSKYNKSWVNFFRENRLGMIFNLINKSNPMPNTINLKIERILNKLEDLIPNNPTPSLIHGDLWEGNILFNKGKIAGLIDPGIHFAHNEMEISYLTWFKYVTDNFLNYYSEIYKIDKYFSKYEPIYQLYYCLLNIHLWDRKYIANANELTNTIY